MVSKHRADKSVREMRGVPETLKRRSARAARKARNWGRQEMEEGEKWRKARNEERQKMEEGRKWRKAENGDVKPAPLVTRETASHALYPTELNFLVEYRSMSPCQRMNHKARIASVVSVRAHIARQQLVTVYEVGCSVSSVTKQRYLKHTVKKAS